MSLTNHQADVLTVIQALYAEQGGPFHYSLLAERMDMSSFAAYDMLRVLEEKGQVRSVYWRDPERSGPGRALRLFEPTDATLPPEVVAAWRSDLRQQLSMRTEIAVDEQGRGLSHEMRFALELHSVILERLPESRGRFHLDAFIGPADVEPKPHKLAFFNAIALGLLLERFADDEEWCRELVRHMEQSTTIMQNLNADDQALLAEKMTAVYRFLRPLPHSRGEE